jgi:hypothetical protein
MKFRLDEALFDDDITEAEPTIKIFPSGYFDEYKIDEFDDDMSFEPIVDAGASTEHNGEAIPEGPRPGIESGIADTLINLINDEWEAIQGYNNFRDMILTMQQSGAGDYSEMIRVIDEVSNEEHLHVGQLQELLKLVSPNTESIKRGEQEGKEQLEDNDHEWVNGKLKVEMHRPTTPSYSEKSIDDNNPNKVDTTCTLYDADDEW